jgi:hypothetical protein
MEAVPFAVGNILDTSQEFKIAQTRKGCIQECLGCEANSQFQFIVNGAIAGMIEEETSCLLRFCCGANRYWDTRMYAGDRDAGAPVLYTFHRYCRLPLGAVKCSFCPNCCFQEVDVTDAAGTYHGAFKETFYCCVPVFHTITPTGEPEYAVHMPTCCGGCCVNCCAQGCCNCRIPFYFYPANNDTEEAALNSSGSTQAPNQEGDTKAQITKIWTGLGQELLTDADTFELKCPDGADASGKARMIAATLMINQVFFESQGQGNGAA